MMVSARTMMHKEGKTAEGRTMPCCARRSVNYLAGGVKSIEADCRVYDIEVTSADVKEITVSWDEVSTWSIDAEYTGNAIRLEESGVWNRRDIPETFTARQYNNLRIVLPEGYAGSLRLVTSYGSIELADIGNVKDIDIKSARGRIGIKNVTVQEGLRVENAEGSVWIEGMTTGGAVHMQTLSGGMRVADVRCGGRFMAVSMHGICGFCNVRAAGYFSASVDSGSIELDMIHADKTDVTSISSPVDTMRLSADTSIAIHTLSGDINCRVEEAVGSYSSYCFSSHGQCDIPYHMGSGHKTLRVDSERGSVDVRFANEPAKGMLAAEQNDAPAADEELSLVPAG